MYVCIIYLYHFIYYLHIFIVIKAQLYFVCEITKSIKPLMLSSFQEQLNAKNRLKKIFVTNLQ